MEMVRLIEMRGVLVSVQVLEVAAMVVSKPVKAAAIYPTLSSLYRVSLTVPLPLRWQLP